MICTCSRIMLGSNPTHSLNWNPDCEGHGLYSEWYNSPEEELRRQRLKHRSIELQKIARQRRRGEITHEEAQEKLRHIDYPLEET